MTCQKGGFCGILDLEVRSGLWSISCTLSVWHIATPYNSFFGALRQEFVMITFLRLSATLVAMVLLVGCSGGSGDSPTQPVSPPKGVDPVAPPPPSLVRIRILGPDTSGTVVSGVPNQFRVIQEWSNGSTSEAQNPKLEVVNDPNLVYTEVQGSGVVTTVLSDSLKLEASAGGKTATVVLRVLGTPMTQLPPLDPEAWELGESFVVSHYGRFLLKIPGPIHVWMDPRITNPQALVDSVDSFLNQEIGVRVVMVSDSAAAQTVVVIRNITQTGKCAEGGIVSSTLGRINKSLVVFRTPRINGCPQPWAIGLAHEIIHGFGIGHVDDENDIMYHTPRMWNFSDPLRTFLRWLYSPFIWPGIRPIF